MELLRRNDISGPESLLARNQVATHKAKLGTKKKDHTTSTIRIPKTGL
jgi:hypothetical protein